MKKYRRYMNGVKAPDTLHRRLRELKAPEKKPAPWARYGAMAAALVLVFGGASVGLHWNVRWSGYMESVFQKASYVPEAADAVHPDIALADPGDVTEPGGKTLGGYDVEEERGGVAVVCRYILPYIEYGEAEGSVALDWDIPEGAARRDLSRDEIVALMGGEDAVNTHLDWGEYELTGWGAWYEDGSFWGAYIDGILPYFGGPASQFQFAVTAGQLPPTCFGYPSSVTQEIRGITVTADKSDWEEHVFSFPSYVHQRRVSFMKDDYGCRFEMSSGDPDMAEEMVSRLVCRIADKGLALTYTCPYCGHTFPFGAVHNDPFIGADATYTCDVCGNTFSVGTAHNDPDVTTADDGEAADPGYNAPVPAVSAEICGYPLAPGGDIAPAVSAEICGLPLNPDGDVAVEPIYD